MVMNSSSDCFAQAQKVIPGGVNSPVRSFKGVGGTPVFFEHAEGAYVTDVEGRSYVDYVGSWGPMVLGHRHPVVIEALQQQLQKALSFGAPTRNETVLAQTVIDLIEPIDMLRLVNSGTEATMTAIRMARGYTQRSKIIKFIGGYHGHSDALLVRSGSGSLTHGVPSSAGVPESSSQNTFLADFNNLEQVEYYFQQFGHDIAAIIVEPVAGNMNLILPDPDFLPGLRRLCTQYGAVLIFDEVMTGFRVDLRGAQHRFNVKPDLIALGKVIGGGLPLAAVGGSRDVMSVLAPLGPVYQAGTLSGNPMATAAGLATINHLIQHPEYYDRMNHTLDTLLSGLEERAAHYRIPFKTQHCGSMFGLFFTEHDLPRNESEVQQCNLTHFKVFFHAMLQQGIYLAPSAFEAGFISMTHSLQEVELTWRAAEHAFQQLTQKAAEHERIL